MQTEKIKISARISPSADSVSAIHSLLNVLRFNLTEIGDRADELDKLYSGHNYIDKSKQTKELMKSHQRLEIQLQEFEIEFWRVLKN